MGVGGKGDSQRDRKDGKKVKIGENRCAYVYRLLNHSLAVPKS